MGTAGGSTVWAVTGPIMRGDTAGQFIFTVPSLKLVVVTTAVPTPDDGRREHQRAIYDLMERHLIPAVERKQLAPVNSKAVNPA